MSAETEGETLSVRTEKAARDGLKCPLIDPHINRDDLRRVWTECQEESFWYRALPFSLGSMAVTGGLIYNGIWKSSKRFGPFPKLAVAGILGYAVGKASYVGACRNKFHEVGFDVEPGFGPWFGKRLATGQRSCQHMCDKCKKTAQAAPADQVQS